MENQLKVKVLGTGGAFDIHEGNSSFWVEMNGLNYLVDCGEDVFAKMVRQKLVDKIDYVCCSHLNGDHFGSLSTLIFYTFFVLKKKLKIFSSPFVLRDLKDILLKMGHTADQFDLIYSDDFLGLSYLTTNDKHMIGLPSCGFLFANKLLISGDIGIPIRSDFDNLAVLHDASTFDSPVHCHYKKLTPSSNLYLYHHSAEARKTMINDGYQCLEPNQELIIA